MKDRVEVRVAAALQDLAGATRADDAVLARLLEAVAEPSVALSGVHRRQRIWPALVSIAAAVVTLAVVITFLARPSSHRPAPPVHSGPSRPAPVTPTATATTSPPQPQVLQRCVVPMPQAWLDRLQEIPPPAAGPVAAFAGLTVLAMTTSGDVITYSNAGDQHAAGALVLVHPDGTTRVLYSIPLPQVGQLASEIQTAQSDGTWVVFDLAGLGDGVRTRIQALNMTSGAMVDITNAQGGAELFAPQLLDGTVYWGEVQPNDPSSGRIYGYTLASGGRTTIDSGEVIGPTVLGGALEWGRSGKPRWLGQPHLPAGYPVIVKPYPLVQDGPAAAWTDWDQSGRPPLPTVMVRRPSGATPQTAYRGPSPNFDAARQPRPFALTGNYLVYTDGTNLLALDLRTGAAIQIQPYEPGFVRAAAANGILAIDTFGSKGGSHLALLHPDDLPEPHC